METSMTSKNLLVFLASVFLLAVLAGNVSAFGDISAVEINGANALAGDFANFAGERVPILVRFDATADAEDVRVKVWISGEREDAVVSERFDVIAGKSYTRVAYIDMPSDIDDDFGEESYDLHESRTLEVLVESRNDGIADQKTIELTLQRDSYFVEILSTTMEPAVNAGEIFTVDVVLKNKGSHFAEDTYLKVRIPELGVETQVYYGDLSPTDRSHPDKEDAVEKRIYLKIPSTAEPGIYTVEFEAFNDDSFTTFTRRVLVESGEDTVVVSSTNSKTFSVGEKGTYTLTLVNKGNEIAIYEISVESPSELNVELSDSVVVVPAGTSRIVKVDASASEEGTHTFTVNINSDSEVTSKTLTAKVEGKTAAGKASPTVLLTVILAIVFVVLLIVLIVLLTRKPVQSEEIGESYY